MPLVVTELDEQLKKRSSKRKPRTKRVRQPDGTYTTRFVIDFASDLFSVDFSQAFQSSVRKARKENKRVIGAADIEPQQG